MVLIQNVSNVIGAHLEYMRKKKKLHLELEKFGNIERQQSL